MINRRRFLEHLVLPATPWPARLEGGGAIGPSPNLDFHEEVARTLAEARMATGRFPGMVAAILRGNRLLGIAANGV